MQRSGPNCGPSKSIPKLIKNNFAKNKITKKIFLTVSAFQSVHQTQNSGIPGQCWQITLCLCARARKMAGIWLDW